MSTELITRGTQKVVGISKENLDKANYAVNILAMSKAQLEDALITILGSKRDRFLILKDEEANETSPDNVLECTISKGRAERLVDFNLVGMLKTDIIYDDDTATEEDKEEGLEVGKAKSQLFKYIKREYELKSDDEDYSQTEDKTMAFDEKYRVAKIDLIKVKGKVETKETGGGFQYPVTFYKEWMEDVRIAKLAAENMGLEYSVSTLHKDYLRKAEIQGIGELTASKQARYTASPIDFQNLFAQKTITLSPYTL